jgi:hypothetical protein
MQAMLKETKSKQFALRMRPAVYEAAERAAADDRRSVASLIELLLEDYLMSNGYLPGKQEGKRRR